MGMIQEFKEFAMKGSVIDLAVGVIIGAAFGKIVSSLVNDIIMPPIGLVLGSVNFSSIFIPLDGKHYDTLADAQKASAPTINIGLFLNNVLDFVIVAFVIFLCIRQINILRRQAPPPSPTTRECPKCTTQIPLKASRCPHCTSEIAPAV